MARCEDCIHYKVCDDWAKSVNDEYCACVELHPCDNFINTADVVPKSEVVKVLDEIEKTIRGALVLVGFSYKHNPKEIQCKKECYEDFLGYIAELKKKYAGGNDNG